MAEADIRKFDLQSDAPEMDTETNEEAELHNLHCMLSMGQDESSEGEASSDSSAAVITNTPTFTQLRGLFSKQTEDGNGCDSATPLCTTEDNLRPDQPGGTSRAVVTGRQQQHAKCNSQDAVKCDAQQQKPVHDHVSDVSTCETKTNN